jgi:hypothetical protein
MPKKTHILQGLKTSYSHLILFHQQHLICQDLVWHSHPVEVNTGGHRISLTVFAVNNVIKSLLILAYGYKDFEFF